ncbi:hypothetical protein QTP88_001727 [Uroleucon formosanum]
MASSLSSLSKILITPKLENFREIAKVFTEDDMPLVTPNLIEEDSDKTVSECIGNLVTESILDTVESPNYFSKCSSGNTGLRGNEGCKNKNEHITEGNFIRTVKLMADFVPVLSKLLNDENLKIKYLSWKIQNEVIDLLATELRSILSTEKILRPLHGVSKNLKYKDTDLQKPRDQLENAYQSIKKLRENYESVVDDAKMLCLKWGILTKYKATRPRFAKKCFDDVDRDRRLEITEENFRIKVFFPVVDTEMIMDKNLKTIGELATFILKNDFSISYSEVLGACMLFLVLPVTVASAET